MSHKSGCRATFFGKSKLFGLKTMNVNPRDPRPAAPVQNPLEPGQEGPESHEKPRNRWFWILLSLATLGMVLTFLSYSEDAVDVSGVTTPLALQPVSIEQVVAAPETVEIRAFAETRPKWSAVLSAPVAGRVDNVLPGALVGEQVEVGTPLIEIENSRYVAELAAAELALKQADLGLWHTKNAAYVARADFERNGIKPPNDLALKLPQLAIAESTVASAQAQVDAAKRQLEDTIIAAPFAAFVTERFVSPGQSVNVGDQLVALSDNTHFELIAEISPTEWAHLKKPISGQTAKVLTQGGDVIAEARIRRGGDFLDETTRQYRVFLDVENSGANAVLGGDLVTLQFLGIAVASALDIPASALTKDGYVWHVDDEDRLQRLEPEVLFRRHNRVIVRSPVQQQNLRIAITPLVSFLPGQKVQPRLAAD